MATATVTATATAKKKKPGKRDKKVYDLNKFRTAVKKKFNYSELMDEMGLPSHASVDQLLLQLMRVDNVWYPEITGGRIQNELTVGKGHTMVLSEAKLSKFDWIVEGSKFKIESEGKDLILRYVEPEVEEVEE